MQTFYVLLLAVTARASSLRGPVSPVVGNSTMCCQGACSGDLQKYYSIDTRHNECGECCMLDSDYDLYHKFEPGLTKANGTVTPCAELGYTTYDETETHGAGPVKMTLDLYLPG